MFRKLLHTIIAITGLALLANPAQADIYLWSQTPASNPNSDLSDDINWVEGMAPSEVNDSARAMMAEIKKWVDDQSWKNGSSLQTTGGTANAQTLSTNGTSSTLTQGWKVCFVVGAGLTNTGAVTLNVDSLGTHAVQGIDGTALAGGELAAGQVYCAAYDANDTVWQLENYRAIDASSITYDAAGALQWQGIDTGDITCATGGTTCTINTGAVSTDEIATDGVDSAEIAADAVTSSELADNAVDTAAIQDSAVTSAKIDTTTVYTMPVVTVFDYAGTSCPSQSLALYGQDVSRTTYSELFTAISTTYGIGDGSTTFTLPDLRGRVVAGQDDMGGTSANRLTDANNGLNGDTLGDAGGVETETLVQGNLPSLNFSHSLSVSTSITNGSSVYRGSSTDDNIDGNNGNLNNVPNAGNYYNLSLASGTVSGTVSSGGSDTAFGVVQPTFILNKCIYAGGS